MISPVPRTCTEFRLGEDKALIRQNKSRPIESFRNCRAYVLLGDPGSGKTTSFQAEQQAMGDDAVFVSARDLPTLTPSNQPGLQGKALFIDGLDEIRVGAGDPRNALDTVRKHLVDLDGPPFRLSCRTADWLLTDADRLKRVCLNQQIVVLSLDPLNYINQIDLISRLPVKIDAETLIQQATDRGLGGMLRNPQTLLMLVDLVSDDDWPSSRMELFDKACQRMAQEFNLDHQVSRRERSQVSKIRETAGHLCSILLLCNKAGFATSSISVTDDYPDITETEIDSIRWQEALSTSLFTHEPHKATFCHRHIAEYLAASFLASRIKNRLPSSRVLTHLSDSSGRVPSHLRGLSGWLAAHSRRARNQLIERDPTGVALYGDSDEFSVSELTALYQSLVKEPKRLQPTHVIAKAFASSVTPSMGTVLVDQIQEKPVDIDDIIVCDFTLRLLAESPAGSERSDVFSDFVLDESQAFQVREAALDALIAHTRKNDRETFLLPMLDGIVAGRLKDSNDEMRGKLLSALYPNSVPANRVWDYYSDKSGSFLGAHARFWMHDIIDQSSDTDIATLLDECSSRLPEFSERVFESFEIGIHRLLLCGLQRHGDDIEITRLYDWLSVGVALRITSEPTLESEFTIRRWLECKVNLHAKIVVEGVARYAGSQKQSFYEAHLRLFGATKSDLFFQECFELVTRPTETDPSVSESLLRSIFEANVLNDQVLRELVAKNEHLDKMLDKLIGNRVSKPPKVAAWNHSSDLTEYQAIKRYESALINGSTPHSVLHYLAKSYFDSFLEPHFASRIDRFRELVKFDKQLEEAITKGLVEVPHRADLPSLEETLQLAMKFKVHFLGLPLLAGIAIQEECVDYNPGMWSDDQLRKALGIYFVYPQGAYRPAWFDYLLENKPNLVAEVQVSCTTARFKERMHQGDLKLWYLAFDPKFVGLAEIAVLPLLQKFPTGIKKDHLDELEYLLIAGLRYADQIRFKALLEAKLALRSLPARQRARWLAVGCALDLDKYEQSATEFVTSGRKETRVLDFLSLFSVHSERQDYSLVKQSNLRLQSLLIRLAGPYVSPRDFEESGILTKEVKWPRRLLSYLRFMSENPSAEATQILLRLVNDEDLENWHEQIKHFVQKQLGVRANSEFREPSVEQLAEILKNGLPSGPADLQALLMHWLEDFNDRARTSDTDEWKQFWNVDPSGGAEKPRPENSCTQVILGFLRDRLPNEIHVEPEGIHSHGNRSDLKVSYDGFSVPIEAKCNNHSQLWQAAKTQLKTKYASDYRAEGFGIYLVYWFGSEGMKASPRGTKPGSASDLQDELESSLSDVERKRISICVLNLSKESGNSA